MLLSIFSTLGNILLFLLILSIVICIHELGHLFFAKRAGILCHEFAFGMGPRLWSIKKGETIYSIRAIPFGGFVSMAGEELESEVLKIKQRILLGFDKDGLVDRIVTKPAEVVLEDFIEVIIEKFDLKGLDDAVMFINEYTVKRDAVYIFDKNKVQIAPHDRNFSNKSKWNRFLVTFGGPLMNFVLAIVIYLFLSFVIGVPNPSSTVIGEVNADMPAYGILLPGDEITAINGVAFDNWTNNEGLPSVSTELAKYLTNDTFVFTVLRDGESVILPPITPQFIFYGLGFVSDFAADDLSISGPLYINSELLAGDVILTINGVAVTTWTDVFAVANNNLEGSSEESPTTVTLDRDGVILSFSYVTYGQDVLDAMGYQPFYSKVGIVATNHFSFFGGIQNAFKSFGNAATSIYQTLALLFSSSQVGISDLSGFVGIYSITANAAAQGFYSLLSWVALLSVNLGIVNLLPIPALDGGRLVFIGYEAITKKKPNKKLENWLHTITFFLLIALLIFVTYNDILRLFGIN